MSGSITYTYQAPPVPVFPAMLLRSDGHFIPLDLANSDYQRFLEWIAAGNAAPEGWTGPKNA